MYLLSSQHFGGFSQLFIVYAEPSGASAESSGASAESSETTIISRAFFVSSTE
jgi:hypothetical protein